MRKWQKHLIAVMMVSLPCSGIALGLGEINLESALYEPFSAQNPNDMLAIESQTLPITKIKEVSNAITTHGSSTLNSTAQTIIPISTIDINSSVTTPIKQTAQPTANSSANEVTKVKLQGTQLNELQTIAQTKPVNTQTVQELQSELATTSQTYNTETQLLKLEIQDLQQKNQELEQQLNQAIEQLNEFQKTATTTQAVPVTTAPVVTHTAGQISEVKKIDYQSVFPWLIVVLILLLPILILFWYRRKKMAKVPVVDTQVKKQNPRMDVNKKSVAETPIKNEIPVQQKIVLPKLVVKSTNDALQEAQVYLNYGHYGQAENILLTALEGDQNNLELWKLLLSVYAESFNAVDFESHVAGLPKNVAEDNELQEMITRLRKAIWNVNAVPAGKSTVKSITPEPTLHVEEISSKENASVDVSLNEIEFNQNATTIDSLATNNKEIIWQDGAMIISALDNEEEWQENLNEETKKESAKTSTSEVELKTFEQSNSTASNLAKNFSEASPEAHDVLLEIEYDSELLKAEQTGIFPEKNPTARNVKESDKKSATAANTDSEYSESIAEDSKATKLDLAQAYIEMGDYVAAEKMLNVVISEGDKKYLKEAQKLLEQLRRQR